MWSRTELIGVASVSIIVEPGTDRALRLGKLELRRLGKREIMVQGPIENAAELFAREVRVRAREDINKGVCGVHW